MKSLQPLRALITRCSMTACFSAALGLALGCSSSNDEGGADYHYGAPEMKATAGGDWTGTITWSAGGSTVYDLSLDYQPPGSQPMCGSRTLTGPTCIDTSSMGFAGILTSADKTFAKTPVTARFEVMGETLTSGHLSIDAGTRALSASFTSGAFTDGQVSESGTMVGSFTMKRP